MPPSKTRLFEIERLPENYLQIEPEILKWFKEKGKDYHARINTVPRAYMETHK